MLTFRRHDELMQNKTRPARIRFYFLIGRHNRQPEKQTKTQDSDSAAEASGAFALRYGTNILWNANNNDINDELEYTPITNRMKQRAQKIVRKLENQPFSTCEN